MQSLIPLAEAIGARLKERGETVAVSESSTGGLISAALLAVPGASAYFLGGAVVYTRQARKALLGIGDKEMAPGIRSASEPYAALARAPCASAMAPPGASPKRARPAPAATATAIPPDTPASPSPARPSAR